MHPEHIRLYHATIEHLRDGTSYRALSRKYSVTISKLRTRVYKQDSKGDLQMFAGTNYMTEDWRDVAGVPEQCESRGRKNGLTTEEESTLKQAVLQFQQDMTPLTRQCPRELVQHFVQMFLSPERSRQVRFTHQKPSLSWVYLFLRRHKELSLKSTRPVENKRVISVNPKVLASHFVRLETMCDKFKIDDPRRIFNVDETGVSVKELTEGRRYKAVCTGDVQPISRGVRFKGSFEHVTIMPVVSAAGDVYSPIVVIPGKRVPWKKVDGKAVLLNHVLPPGSLLYQKEKASVDKDIFEDWVSLFIKETERLREGGKKVLLVMDCFKGHIQYRSIMKLKSNGIVVCGLPAHTSHELLPLDATLFNTFKAHLKNSSRSQVTAAPTGKIDLFGTASLIPGAYNKCLSRDIVVSGFLKTAVWNAEKRGPDKDAVQAMKITSPSPSEQSRENIRESVNDSNVQVVRHIAFDELVSSYGKEKRSLLYNGTIEDKGFVDVDCSHGVHLTADTVPEVFRKKEERRVQEAVEKEERARERERKLQDREKEEVASRTRVAAKKRCREEKAEALHVGQVLSLQEQRGNALVELTASRRKRRFIRRMKACMTSNTGT